MFVSTWALTQTACKKESTSTSNNSGGGAKTCLLDSVDGGKVTWDASNRATQLTTPEGTVINLTYNGNKVNYAIDSDSLDFAVEVTLNGSNYPSTAKANFTIQGFPGTLTMDYTYNAEGQVIRQKQTLSVLVINQVTITDFEYANGNMVKSTSYAEDEPEAKTITEYTYYTDKTDSRNASLSKIYVEGLGIAGTGSKNLVKKSIETAPDTDPVTTNFTYTFDADGKVLSEIATDEDSGEQSIATYSYICK